MKTATCPLACLVLLLFLPSRRLVRARLLPRTPVSVRDEPHHLSRRHRRCPYRGDARRDARTLAPTPFHEHDIGHRGGHSRRVHPPSCSHQPRSPRPLCARSNAALCAAKTVFPSCFIASLASSTSANGRPCAASSSVMWCVPTAAAPMGMVGCTSVSSSTVCLPCPLRSTSTAHVSMTRSCGSTPVVSVSMTMIRSFFVPSPVSFPACLAPAVSCPPSCRGAPFPLPCASPPTRVGPYNVMTHVRAARARAPSRTARTAGHSSPPARTPASGLRPTSIRAFGCSLPKPQSPSRRRPSGSGSASAASWGHARSMGRRGLPAAWPVLFPPSTAPPGMPAQSPCTHAGIATGSSMPAPSLRRWPR